MKLKNIILFSLDGFLCNKKNKMIFIVLLAASFFMIGMLMASRTVTSYAWKDCDATLKKGIKETGLVSITQYNTPEGKKLLSSAWSSGAFESIGGFTYPMGVNDRLYKLWNKQKELANPDITPQYLWWINIDEYSLELCNLEYEQFESISDEKHKDENWNGLILGSNYKDIPVGTIYKEEIIPGTIWTYEVVGILKKDSRMISAAVLNMGKGSNFQSSILLDDYILRINSKASVVPSWAYTMKWNVSLSEGKDILTQLANQNNLDLTFAYLADGFEMDEADQKTVNNILLQILVLVIITTFFMNLFLFLLSFFNRSHELGVFYATGFSLRDMLWIQLTECSFEFLVAFLISWFALTAYLKSQGGKVTAIQQGVQYLLKDVALPSMTFACLIFFLLFNLIPIAVISKHSPVSLVRRLKG